MIVIPGGRYHRMRLSRLCPGQCLAYRRVSGARSGELIIASGQADLRFGDLADGYLSAPDRGRESVSLSRHRSVAALMLVVVTGRRPHVDCYRVRECGRGFYDFA